MSDDKKTQSTQDPPRPNGHDERRSDSASPPAPRHKPGFMVIREMTDKKRETAKKSAQNGTH